MAKNTKFIKTDGEVLDQLQKLVDKNGRDIRIVLTIPYKDGIGFRYADIKNISFWNNLIDIHIEPGITFCLDD